MSPTSFRRKGDAETTEEALQSLTARARVPWLVLAPLLAPLPAWGDAPAVAQENRRAAILAPASDFSRAERWEELSGGTATNRTRFGPKAFSQFSTGLALASQADFFIGDGLFRRPWVTAPSSTRSADGLGPLYNARACQRCHLRDGRGHPPEASADGAVSMVLRLSRPAPAGARAHSLPDPVYGHQLQDLAIPGHPPEGRIEVRYREVTVAVSAGAALMLRRPEYRIADLGYGPMHAEVRLSPRVAPPMIGLGLLEAVAEEAIVAAADPTDRDGDGISGRPNRVWSTRHKRVMLGRFGWKAEQPGLPEQSASAFFHDMGLSNPLHAEEWGDCTEAQRRCRTAPHGESEEDGGFEVPQAFMKPLLIYVRNLAVPARREVSDATVLRGKKLFYNAGCTGCHAPKMATRKDYPIRALAGQLIWPYTDLLLHDMGDGLADDHPEGEASGREWRTPPLWGIGLTQDVSGHTYFLHDGRARNLAEAVLWHGGEAKASRDQFAAMQPAQRDALIAFLNSL